MITFKDLPVRAPATYTAINRAFSELLEEFILPNVKAYTPIWKGDLREQLQSHTIAPSAGAVMEGEVYFRPAKAYGEHENIVAKVMELGGSWSKWPPYQPIYAWVIGKLGLTGDDAVVRTHQIRGNIFKHGIQLPLKFSGLGRMMQRTFDALSKGVAANYLRAKLNIHLASVNQGGLF